MPYYIKIKQRNGRWASYRDFENKTKAESEFERLGRPDSKGMVHILGLFHGRKKLKQNFYA